METKFRQDARLGLRLSHAHKEKIERAALTAGLSVSDFITSTMVREAEAVLEEQARIVLQEDERDFFLALLAGDEAPNAAALAAAERYRQGWRDGVDYRW